MRTGALTNQGKFKKCGPPCIQMHVRVQCAAFLHNLQSVSVKKVCNNRHRRDHNKLTVYITHAHITWEDDESSGAVASCCSSSEELLEVLSELEDDREDADVEKSTTTTTSVLNFKDMNFELARITLISTLTFTLCKYWFRKPTT